MESFGFVWFLCLAGGLVWVIVQFWGLFNEPTHTAKLELFRKYAPRFATREQEFMRARYGYVALISGLYVTFSVSPQLVVELVSQLSEIPGAGALKTLLGNGEKPGDVAELSIFPILVAAALTNARSIPGLREVEFRIRSFFHTLGRIPETVQSTVGQLRSSTFDFRFCCGLGGAHAEQVRESLGVPSLSEEAVMSDDVLRAWFMIRCLTDRLAGLEADDLPVGRDFLDAYNEELGEIIAERDVLTPEVAEHAIAVTGGTNGPVGASEGSDVRSSVRNLRERLFVFIACGFRSSATTDVEVTKGLRKLGFDVRVQPPPDRSLRALVGAVFLYLICMTFVAALLARLFHEWTGLDRFNPGVTGILLVPAPEQEALRWLWTLSSGVFSLAAIAAAFAIRRERLNRFDWFRLDCRERERPMLSCYPWTAIVSGLIGIGVLLGVSVVMGYFFAPPEVAGSVPRLLGSAFGGASIWLPLAVIVALAGLYVVDDDYLRMPRGKRLALAAGWSCVVGLIGGLIAFSKASTNLSGSVEGKEKLANEVAGLRRQIEVLAGTGNSAGGSGERLLPDASAIRAEMILKQDKLRELTEALPELTDAIPYAVFLIGALIFVQTLYMLTIVQALERSAQLSIDPTDRWLNLRASTGEEQEIFLARDSRLIALDAEAEKVRPVGRWVQYPECQVLRWEVPLPFGRHELSGRGLLQREGGVIVYTDQAEGGSTGEFVAQGSFTQRRQSIRQSPLPDLKVVGA